MLAPQMQFLQATTYTATCTEGNITTTANSTVDSNDLLNITYKQVANQLITFTIKSYCGPHPEIHSYILHTYAATCTEGIWKQNYYITVHIPLNHVSQVTSHKITKIGMHVLQYQGYEEKQ